MYAMPERPRFRYECFIGQPNNNIGRDEWIDLRINVKHNVWLQQQQTIILSHANVTHLSLLMSSQEFFENGLRYVRLNMPQPTFPDVLLNTMMLQVTSHVRRFLHNCASWNRNIYNPSPFPLRVDVVLNSRLNEHQVINMVTRDSISEVRMVPASQEAIKSLKKVNLAINDERKQCTICLEEFEETTEVSTMPCNHAYHQECIEKWLETNHMCPLCRYTMPI